MHGCVNLDTRGRVGPAVSPHVGQEGAAETCRGLFGPSNSAVVVFWASLRDPWPITRVIMCRHKSRGIWGMHILLWHEHLYIRNTCSDVLLPVTKLSTKKVSCDLLCSAERTRNSFLKFFSRIELLFAAHLGLQDLNFLVKPGYDHNCSDIIKF